MKIQSTEFSPVYSTKACIDVNTARQKLSSLLFGRSLRNNSPVTFGWSKSIPPEQVQILDILTNVKNQKVLVLSHNEPDGDAFGSIIGVSGILKSLGAKVTAIIDDKKAFRFSSLPSPEMSTSAIDYVYNNRNFDRIKTNQFEVAVVTDCFSPKALSAREIDLLKRSKKVIIIDHHPDEPFKSTNKSMWINALRSKNPYFNVNNVIYWNENRESSSEMVTELDKEIVEAHNKGDLKAEYLPQKYKVDLNYRLTTAAGIISDVDGSVEPRGKVFDTKFLRASTKTGFSNVGIISLTRLAFDWLINNCGLRPSDVDMRRVMYYKRAARTSQDDQQKDKMIQFVDQIIDGRKEVPGITVFQPSKRWPMSAVFISSFKELDKGAQDLDDKHNLASLIKWRLKNRLLSNPRLAGFVFAVDFPKQNRFSLNVNTYGKPYLFGNYQPDNHVIADSLAQAIILELRKEGVANDVGGHTNCCGLKSLPGKSFIDDAMPVIQRVVRNYRIHKPDPVYNQREETSRWQVIFNKDGMVV